MGAAVPHDHRPGAVLALRDHALEAGMAHRMVLRPDRQPFVLRIQRWALRHRHDFSTPSASRRKS